jgi:hypothetical protein
LARTARHEAHANDELFAGQRKNELRPLFLSRATRYVEGENFMVDNNPVWTRQEIERRYGEFYNRATRLVLDPSRIPERLWPLIPYAEFWGVSDDSTLLDLIAGAPVAVHHNLKLATDIFNDDLTEWLAGPEADKPGPSGEYVAFCAMWMAADYPKKEKGKEDAAHFSGGR